MQLRKLTKDEKGVVLWWHCRRSRQASACAKLHAVAVMGLVVVLTLPARAALADTAIVEVVDSEDQPVADAAVFLTPSGDTARAGNPERGHASAIMDQIGYQFVPRVLVVRTGTEVAFPNSDNVLHHVYSFSEAKRFEPRSTQDESCAGAVR
jgi:plastocyanin